jgi:FkbM family methyltransferase
MKELSVSKNSNVWKPEEITQIISQASAKDLIVDVGAHRGAWMNTMIGHINSEVIKIGIDPFKHNITNLANYNHFYAFAISLTEEHRHLYTFKESSLNSLLPLSEDVDSSITKGSNEGREIKTKTLETIFNGLEFNNIHILKTDCQGCDIDVVESAGKYLDRIQYVLTETLFDDEKSLYQNQKRFGSDFIRMNRLGFEPIYFVTYDTVKPLEGDVFWKKGN